MNIEEAKELVEPFFKMSEFEVMQKFADASREVVIHGEDDYTSLFIPGTRDDRVLLVAHADTVFQDTPHLEVAYRDGLFMSAKRYRGLTEKKKLPEIGGLGIGADDRAGCAALWHLRESGHSLLITNCEECGCLSAMQLMANDNMADLIQSHRFALQFDRKGRNDLVFYDVGTDEFIEYCQNETGYEQKDGSFTDICVLCERICGVNISVGYKNEHTCNEVLNLRWFANTMNVCSRWLAKEIPSFER